MIHKKAKNSILADLNFQKDRNFERTTKQCKFK